ncbi:MAG: methylated-DNA--[protein]-cysteine S-methyltransferase [Dehalococcoidia bacterium]|nr:methylated-DNA--[protein]-cysteine S-methyltransferase [Dehalococcoidia bacterium]
MLSEKSSSELVHRNTRQQHFTTFETELGWVGLVATQKGLSQLTLPQTNEKETLSALNLSSDAIYTSADRLASAVSHIRDYFKGHPIYFNEALDLSAGSIFAQKVWNICRIIPYGQTRSYGWLAGQLGQPNAARAVGNSLGKNPIPIIIPCHRVIAANGNIGGFSGGLETKRQLLTLEGIWHFCN